MLGSTVGSRRASSEGVAATYFTQRKLFVSLRFVNRWKFWLSWSIPFLFLPVLSATGMSPEGRCGYILLVVACFWVLNLIPLPIASLIPLFMCPMLGVLSSKESTDSFMQEVSYLLFGGIATALGIEHSKLHMRIALRTLITFGTQPRWLLLGFMLSTAFLSMWINNTSTCALMLPITESVLAEMFPTQEELEALGLFDPGKEEQRKADSETIRRMILVSVCMSCNLGGTGTLTGTGPNVILVGVLVKTFGDDFHISYLAWMEFAVPALIVSMLVSWLVLQVCFLGFKKTFLKPHKIAASTRLNEILKEKLKNLGRMSYHEITIAVLFGLLIILWMTRDPRLTRDWQYGWKFLFYDKKPIKDSAAAILILVIMCMVPALPLRLFHHLNDRKLDQQAPSALDWKIIEKNLGWGVLIIIGGGLTLSAACKDSGLTIWAVTQLEAVQDVVSRQAMLLLCLILVLLFTTVTSNSATAALIVPVMAPLGTASKVNPLYYMLPTTIVCSYSFLLPVSTPPNTMVYDRGGIRIIDMLVPGIIVSIFLLPLLVFWMEVYAPVLFDMDDSPSIT